MLETPVVTGTTLPCTTKTRERQREAQSYTLSDGPHDRGEESHNKGGSSASDVATPDRPGTELAGCARTSSASQKGGDFWLDGITIALGQESGQTWYTSTLELQLASFEVCVACRGRRTLRVTVGKRMPLSFWSDENAVGDSLNTPESGRLPALRAAGVSWVMPAGMIVPILTETVLLREVEWMQVTGVGCRRISSQATSLSNFCEIWKRPGARLVFTSRNSFAMMKKFLALDDHMEDTMYFPRTVSWPSSLRQLSIACISNEQIDWVGLPSSLERLALGGCFHQPIESAAWPVSLKHHTLGGWFDRAIADVVWPASLLRLTFRDKFDQPIAGVVWPDYLLELTFGDWFDKPITDVLWPASLLQLAFKGAFDQPIDDVVWPGSLEMLAFGRNFNQPIDGVVWPASLNRLVLGDAFNLPITEVVWPIALESLAFGHEFDQPMEEVVWPASLRCVAFSDTCCERLDAVELPLSLELEIFEDEFYEQDDGCGWPLGSDSFDQPKLFSMEDF